MDVRYRVFWQLDLWSLGQVKGNIYTLLHLRSLFFCYGQRSLNFDLAVYITQHHPSLIDPNDAIKFCWLITLTTHYRYMTIYMCSLVTKLIVSISGTIKPQTENEPHNSTLCGRILFFWPQSGCFTKEFDWQPKQINVLEFILAIGCESTHYTLHD